MDTNTRSLRERLRERMTDAEWMEFERAEREILTATPDGPHYRTASQGAGGEIVRYAPSASLHEARRHAVDTRAFGHRSWLQVTNDLGLTWTDCGDDGAAVAVADPNAPVVRTIGFGATT